MAQADVVTTNWRPGAAARLGVDYEALRARFPRLIYCNSRGYEKGPRSDLPGTDQTAAALTGAEWEDGARDTGNPPLWSRSNMGDTGNAMLAAIAITAALYHRERTGEGQEVSTSIVNAGLFHTSYAWVHEDGSPAPWDHVDVGQYGLGPFYRMYRCAGDSWLFVAAVDPVARDRLGGVVGGFGDGSADPATVLEGRFATRPAAEWFDLLDAEGVPAEIVNEEFCRTLFDDPAAVSSQLVAQTWSGSVGRFEDPGLLVETSPATGVIQRGPCMCGEHTREILLEVGYSPSEIDTLVEQKAVLDAPVERV